MKVTLAILVTQMERNKMEGKKYILIAFCVLTSSLLYGQNEDNFIEGKVSFITSKNVYVKFLNTASFSKGDTLYILSDEMPFPCLKINQKSSTSAVCIKLGTCEVKKGDLVRYIIKVKNVQTQKVTKIDTQIINNTPTSEINHAPITNYNERIRARISASSSSSKYHSDEWNHRLNYRFSMNANHINNSKWSVVSYMNYRQRILPKGTTSNYPTNTFRIYNLGLIYNVDSTLTISIGRKTNHKASSLGALDGLQLEKFFGKNYVGVIIGSRPDLYDYSFNPNLFQYGAFIGRSISSKTINATTTLGFIEQKNNGFVDRRYSYFQHSSNLNRKISVYGSVEVDLYKKLNSKSSSDLRLSSLYVSSRYKFNQSVNLTLSYNSRKRLIYYQSFSPSFITQNDDESRQGLRIRLNVRPIKNVNTGLSFGKRFQSSRQNESLNINGYLSWSRLPYLKGRFSTNYNLNKSIYLQSNVWSFRHSRSMFRRKILLDLYFRMVDYTYLYNEIKRSTKYYGLNISFRLTRKLSVNVLGEFSNLSNGKGYRINSKIIQRFDKKNKR